MIFFRKKMNWQYVLNMNPFVQLPDDIIFAIFAELNIFDSWATSLVCHHLRGLFLRHHRRLEENGDIRAKFYATIIDLVGNEYREEYYVDQFMQVPDINCLNFMWNIFSPHSRYRIKRRNCSQSVVDYFEMLLKNLLTDKIKQNEAILIYEFIVAKFHCELSKSKHFIIYGKHERRYFTDDVFAHIVKYRGKLDICIDFIDSANIAEIFETAIVERANKTIMIQIFVKVCEYLNDALITICNKRDTTVRELVISYIKLAFPINANLTKIAIAALIRHEDSLDDFAKNIFGFLETSNNIELFCFAAKVIGEIIVRKKYDTFYISRTLKYYHLQLCEKYKLTNVSAKCDMCGKHIAEH